MAMSELPSGSSAGGMAFTVKDSNMRVTGSVNCDNTVHITNNNYLGSTSSNVGKISSWLCIEQYQASQDKHHMRRAEGTLEVFLKSNAYTAWVKDEGTQSLHLECRGMPGAGKSTLASAVVDDLQSRLSSDLVVYAYFRYDAQPTQTPEFVIANFLGQAVKKCGEVSTEVLALYEEYYTPNAKTVPRLDKTIHAFPLNVSGRKLYVVLDALDEYSVEHYDKALVLLNALQSLKAKLLVTSRHSVPFPANTFSSVEVHADPNDVRILINEHVQKYHRLSTFIKDSPELLEEIITKISEHARGMFIIVPLQLDLLSSQMTPDGVRKELAHLPAGLDKTYELAMERIHMQGPEPARIADESFTWVFYAVEPLYIKQLQHAVSFDIAKRRIGSEYLIPIEDILAACCGLIIVVDDKCQFVHFSTKEFFQRNKEKYLPGAERKITEKCLCYAAVAAAQLAGLDSDAAIEDKISDMSLCTYASSYWGPHASHILEDFNQIERLIEDLVKQALWPKMVDEWETRVYGASTLPSHSCLILYLARYGLIKLLRVYWNSSPLAAAVAISEGCLPDNPNLARGGDGWAAIHFAAWNNHKEIVQFLIERGVEVNLSTKWGDTSLHLSASCGHDSIAQTLLDNGANPNLQDQYGNAPLHKAIRNGYLSLAAILLDAGARPDIVSNYGRTLLHVAAESGHDSIAQTLLGKGLDPNAKDNDGGTPLHDAINNGHSSLATILFNNGAKLDMINKYGRTLLHVSASSGHDSIAQTLLDKGLDRNAQDNDGDTPLHKAIRNGHLSLATILFNSNARSDTRNIYGRTLLHVAAENGHASIAQILLDKSLDPNAQDKDGNTPLHKAIDSGHLSLATILLDNGAHPDIASNYGRTLLHVAAERGHASIAQTLLGKCLDPNARDKYGNTPLQLAIGNDHLLLAAILLDHGAHPDTHTASKYGRILLDIAARHGHDSVAQILLGNAVDPNTQDKSGNTPLHLAIDAGHLSLATILLNEGARPGIASNCGRTPLHIAAKEGHDAIALTLLGKGAVPDGQDNDGNTPLHKAVDNDRFSLVNMLLDNGADINRPNKSGETILHNAATQGHAKVVSLLIERGANLAAIDKDGKTALDHALDKQFSDIVNLINMKYKPSATGSPPNQFNQALDDQSLPKDTSPLPEINQSNQALDNQSLPNNASLPKPNQSNQTQPHPENTSLPEPKQRRNVLTRMSCLFCR